MKMALLITDGRIDRNGVARKGQFVTEIVAIGQEFPVAAPCEWMEVADTVTVGDFLDGSTFVKQAAPTELEMWEGLMRAIAVKINREDRFWEELAEGSISEESRARMDVLIAEKKALRDQRPT